MAVLMAPVIGRHLKTARDRLRLRWGWWCRSSPFETAGITLVNDTGIRRTAGSLRLPDPGGCSLL